MGTPIRDFSDLLVWQEGHKLVLGIYVLTKKFPKEEVFGLVNQMRRAAVSVTSNIAEGFGRQGYKEKIQFYYIFQGSIIELKDQLPIARDIQYIDSSEYADIRERADKAHKLLQGLRACPLSFMPPQKAIFRNAKRSSDSMMLWHHVILQDIFPCKISSFWHRQKDSRQALITKSKSFLVKS